MGIYIYMTIDPDRIQPERWKSVYQKTLCLLEQYPFLDIREKEENGVVYSCACRSENRTEKESNYWQSYGDMLHGRNTEWFGLYDNLERYRMKLRGQMNQVSPESREILQDVLLERLENGYCHIVRVWGNKTQGEDSHIYLLAIGCLICHYFPDAVDLYGDISAGQCRKAVWWANQFLEEPIDIPDSADPARLLPRLVKLGRTEKETMELFYQLSLEGKGKRMGTALRQYLAEETIHTYYMEKMISENKTGERQVNWSVMKEYLAMGFPLKGLCRILATAPEGLRMSPRELLKTLLMMKLHVSDKVTVDLTTSFCEREDCEQVEDVGFQFSRVIGMMSGSGNRNVDAYIPLEQIYEECSEVLELPKETLEIIGEEILSELEEESKQESMQNFLYDNPDSPFAKMVDRNQEESEKYDIISFDDLIRFKKDSRVKPDIHEGLLMLFRKLRTFGDEESEDFFALDQVQRERFVLQYERVLLPEEIQKRILQHIMDDSFILRYVSLLVVDIRSDDIGKLIRAALWNPEFLDYYWEQTAEEKP